MTAVHDDEQPDTYQWRAAPSHLKTRRQLRAAGLSPGGQEVAALMLGRRRGRRMIAHLYDIAKARPKRVPSAAQLDAITKATREHQARAAERHGYPRTDLTVEADPGSQWDRNRPSRNHSQENNDMNSSDYQDTTGTGLFAPDNMDRLRAGEQRIRATMASIAESEAQDAANEARRAEDARPKTAAEQLAEIQAETRADLASGLISPEQAAWVDNIQVEDEPATAATSADEVEAASISAEVRALAESGRIDVGLADYVDDVLAGRPAPELGTDPGERLQQWIDRPEAEPVGHGQRLAYLYALVAVNQAGDRQARYVADMDEAECRGQAAADAHADRIETILERDEAALAAMPANNREARVTALATALLWKNGSPVAAARVEEITGALAQDWGVIVDVDEFSVSIDETFDAHTAQVAAEAHALRARDLAAVEVVAAAPLPDNIKATVGEVMAAWTAKGVNPADPQNYLDAEPHRQAELAQELSKIQMPENDRVTLEFAIDYLRGDLKGIDLLDTPVQVDPGEEVRGRVPKLLGHFARGEVQPKRMAEEISVMTDADQDKVREAGRAIAAKQPVEVDIWPGYVDREHISEELMLYAMDAGDLRDLADYIVDEAESFAEEDPERLGVNDDTPEKIERMATRREQLQAAAETGKGLTAMERHQITAVLADIDCGRIADEKGLPELMWVDERTKSEADLLRGSRTAGELSTATRKEVRELIQASGTVEAHSHPGQIIDHAVSRIGDAVFSVAEGAPLGVEYERKEFAEKREYLGRALDKAGVDLDTKLKVRDVIDGRAREAGQLGRPAAQRRTQWKTRTDAAVTHREDQTAQRRAITNQRAPRSNGRNCATRADRSAQPSSPAPARHSMRRTGPEVER